jgi:hypothetical protein
MHGLYSVPLDGRHDSRSILVRSFVPQSRKGMAAMAGIPVLPEATGVGALSAPMGRPPAVTAYVNPSRPECALSDHRLRACRTG